MIARTWNGSTSHANADKYVRHLRTDTFPALRRIPGHRGAYVMRRSAGPLVQFMVITLWESIDAIRRFAGDDAETAVVPPAAQALLAAYDDRAVHWEVALDNPERADPA